MPGENNTYISDRGVQYDISILKSKSFKKFLNMSLEGKAEETNIEIAKKGIKLFSKNYSEEMKPKEVDGL